MRALTFLVSLIFTAMAVSAFAQDDEFILYSEEGDWLVYEQPPLVPEDPESCFAYHEETSTNIIHFLFIDGMTTLMVQREDWELPPNMTYPVFIQIDNNDPIETIIFTLDTSDAVMVDEDITPILGNIKAGRTLYIHTETTTYQYDLTGSSAAINSAQACLSKRLHAAATPNNPFLANQESGPANPFAAQPSEDNTSYMLDPFMELDAYKDIFYELTDIGLAVDVGPTSSMGTYEALIEETAYNFYWEEDTSTRDTVTVFADVLADFTESCPDMATTKLAEEDHGTYSFHQGSFACSNQAEDISLYFRLSIFDWSEFDIALIFLTTGNMDTSEIVEIIDDIVVDNMTVVFEGLE